MNYQELIKQLNWLYSQELSQVDRYIAQSQKMQSVEQARTLQHFAKTEQLHANYIANFILRQGAEPTSLGDVLAPIVGQLTGQLSALTGLERMFQLNIALEQKIANEYRNLLNQIAEGKELIDALWDNLVDEELHTIWFEDQAQQVGVH